MTTVLSLRDFYLLSAPLAEAVTEHFPLPVTIRFAEFAADGTLNPMSPTLTGKESALSESTPVVSTPGLIDDRLLLPLDLPSGERVAVLVDEADPALLRKMSTGWLRRMSIPLLRELVLVRRGFVDPETGLYNSRAAASFFQGTDSVEPCCFLLLNTVFSRRTAAGNLQKTREIADLLQALTRSCCFAFGYGVFGVLLPTGDREQAMKTAHFLQRHLRREGLSRVQVGFARISGRSGQSTTDMLERSWRSLAIAEKRGPFGLCDIEGLDKRTPDPFALTDTTLLSTLKKRCRGLSRFSLVMVAWQTADGLPPTPVKAAIPLSSETGMYLGEDDNRVLILLPEVNSDDVMQEAVSIRALYEQGCAEGQFVAMGIASWPCLDYTKGDIPGNCLKALLHGSFLGLGSTTFFDHLSLNVSGDVYFEEGNYKAAIREYRRGLRLQPDDLNLSNSLGVALAECGQERRAAVCFQQVLSTEPDNTMALINLGHAYLALGEKDLALFCFERAYGNADRPESGPQELLLPLGKLYTEFGRYREALAVFERWCSFPGSEQEFLLFRLLAQAYLENDRPEEAIRACQRALQLFPQDSVCVSLLGLLYVEQGEGDELGLTLCRKALALDHFNADHWYRLARALFHTGDRAAAMTAILKCLGLQRSHGEALLLCGRIHQLEQKNRQAGNCFRRALAVKGCSPGLAQRAGELLAALNIPDSV